MHANFDMMSDPIPIITLDKNQPEMDQTGKENGK